MTAKINRYTETKKPRQLCPWHGLEKKVYIWRVLFEVFDQRKEFVPLLLEEVDGYVI